ncbi:endonuclease VII domain-containing protein [Kitasatospora sp. LaBMicrA B282]|uniref:endonuclease VII domain-containing protein n=1 Tax=Kitasatospora sp. LaBMicrA B282 TaxID=3420949 RepID=UPI003D125787
MSELHSEAHCSRCKQILPAADFARNRSRWNGLQAICRACSAFYYDQRQLARGKVPKPRVHVPEGHKRCAKCEHIKPHAEWDRNRRASDGLSAYCKACRKIDNRRRHFEKNYGMTEADLQAMLDTQAGRCPICLDRPAEHVDHDHETGRVRGILCFACNAALGQMRDRPDALRRAADYLEGIVWKPT